MKGRIVMYIVIFCLSLSMVQSMQPLFIVPQDWPEPNYNFEKNPLRKESIELGRKLFYDPILSADSTISCASCHSSYNAFSHTDHKLSHGIGDSIGNRNAPALMNLAWSKLLMWDGAVNHLDVQSLAPITNADEMGEKLDHVIFKLSRSAVYQTSFEKAFGDSKITGEHLLKALSQFMLTMESYNSKYDQVKRGETSFTQQEEKGYKIFHQNCSSCHPEPLFTTGEFENNGLIPDPVLNDIGRMKITQNPNDSLRFKVPTLRNIEFTYPYMHDGRFRRISDVISHYTGGINHSSTLSSKLDKPIVLTSEDKVDLTSFLLTLTDKTFLFNPELSFPKNNYPMAKD